MSQLGFLFEEEPPPTPADPNDLVPSDSRWAALFAIGNRSERSRRQLDHEPHHSDFMNEQLNPEGRAIYEEVRQISVEFEREKKQLASKHGIPCMQKACMEYWAERFRQREKRPPVTPGAHHAH